MPKTIFGGPHGSLVELVIEARKAAGITQTELARRIGRDQTLVSLIERGQRRIDVLEFIDLAKALEVEPDEMFDRLLKRIGETPPN